jgi:hypothetical protein
MKDRKVKQVLYQGYTTGRGAGKWRGIRGQIWSMYLAYMYKN